MIHDELFSALAKDARKNILEGHLNDAIAALATMATGDNMHNCLSRISDIRADYNRMLDFMRQGGQDDSRHNQQLRLQHLAIAVLQDIRHARRIATSDDIFVRTYNRLAATSAGEDRPLSSWLKSDNWKDSLFDILWTSPQLTAQESNLVELSIQENNFLAAFAMSGLTLALLEYFDVEKLRLLLSRCNHADNPVRIKALLGVFVCTEVHSDLMQLYPDEAELVRRTVESNVEEATLLQHFVCCTVESQRLYRQLHEEILPRIVRSHQGFQKPEVGGERHIILNLSDHSLSKDLQQKIERSFRDMAGLIRDGMIPSSGVFESLRHNPYFLHPDKWLQPFVPGVIESEFAEFLCQLNLCDCDRYAFAILMTSTNEEQTKQLYSQLEQSHLKFADAGGNTSVVRACYNAVECFSRLLTQSPWSSQWPQAMSVHTNYATTPILSDVLAHNAHFLSRTIAFCIRHKRFDMALLLLKLMQKSQGTTASVLRRMAYCEQSLADNSAAIRHLREALTLDPDHFETLETLHVALGRDGQLEAQRVILMRMEELRPDSPEVLVNLGNCLMKLNDWKEAQKRFFHLEFSGQSISLAERAIAWCALMLGDLTRARRYYDRLLSEPSETHWEDYLNCGHVAWLQGNPTEALSLYREYARKYMIAEPNAENALSPFLSDGKTLTQLGINPSDQALMHDLIQQSL